MYVCMCTSCLHCCQVLRHPPCAMRVFLVKYFYTLTIKYNIITCCPVPWLLVWSNETSVLFWIIFECYFGVVCLSWGLLLQRAGDSYHLTWTKTEEQFDNQGHKKIFVTNGTTGYNGRLETKSQSNARRWFCWIIYSKYFRTSMSNSCFEAIR